MSIIGTRPPLISETSLYELHHRARLAIKSALCLGRFLHISGTKRIKEVFYRQHIDNHKSYCYSRYNISGKQFLNRSVI